MIPASQIESIEIISQPGAEYQSDGINGIVNIILKKNYEIGTSGSVQFIADSQDGYNGNLTIQNKTGPLQFTASYEKLNRQANKNDTGFQNKLNEDGTIKESISINKDEIKRFDNETARLNVKYQAPKQWILEGEYIYGKQEESKVKEEINLTTNPDGSFKKGQNRLEDENKELIFNNAFVKASKIFNNESELEFSLNTNLSEEGKFKLRNDFNTTENGSRVESANPKRQRETETATFVNLYPSAHYKFNFKNNSVVKVGYQGFIINRESQKTREDFDFDNSTYELKPDNANDFRVLEQTHAFFITSNWDYKKFSFTAGLRQEITNIESKSVVDSLDLGFGDYAITLPNAKVTYKPNDYSYFTASIGRRIRRPGYNDLNPFREIKDLTEIKEGNPDLQPEKAWSYELGYFRQLNKVNYGINVFFRDIHDLIQKSVTTIDNDVILEKPINLNGAYTAGIEFIAAANPKPWWNINFNYSRFYSEIKDADNFDGDAIKDQTAYTLKAINDFKLGKKTTLQLVGNLVGPKASTQETEDIIYFVDLGLERTFLENGRFILRLTDAFDTLKKVKTKNAGSVIEEKVENTPGMIFSAGLKWNF